MGNEEVSPTKEGENFSNPDDPPIPKVGSSTEITEDNPEGQHQRHRELSLEIQSNSLEDARFDIVTIQTPPIPSSTPKRVNFSPMPSPSFAQMNEPPDPSSSKIKSNIRSLLPKLSFKYRNSTLDIEKAAAMLALGGSSETTKQKPFISRTLSLTKLFTLRTTRTSSLPVTPIAHSNPESMHGGSMINPPSSVKRPIHRSHSVPDFRKDGSIRKLDSLGGLFRVVPSTPRVAEEAVSIMTTSNASPRNDTGIAILVIALNCSLSPQNQKAVKRKRRGVFMDTESPYNLWILWLKKGMSGFNILIGISLIVWVFELSTTMLSLVT